MVDSWGMLASLQFREITTGAMYATERAVYGARDLNENEADGGGLCTDRRHHSRRASTPLSPSGRTGQSTYDFNRPIVRVMIPCHSSSSATSTSRRAALPGIPRWALCS